MSSPPPSKIQKKSSSTYGRAAIKRRSTTQHLPLPSASSSSSESELTPIAFEEVEGDVGGVGKKRKLGGGAGGGKGKEREVDWEEVPLKVAEGAAGMGGKKKKSTNTTTTTTTTAEESEDAGGGRRRRKLSRREDEDGDEDGKLKGAGGGRLKRAGSRGGGGEEVEITSFRASTRTTRTRGTRTNSRMDGSKEDAAVRRPLAGEGEGEGQEGRREEGPLETEAAFRRDPPSTAAPSAAARPPPLPSSRSSALLVSKPSASASTSTAPPRSQPPSQPPARTTTTSSSSSSSSLLPAAPVNATASTSKLPSPCPLIPTSNPHSPTTSSKLIISARPSTPTQSQSHSRPSSLTPTQIRHQLVGTPSKPARNLSALFESHGMGVGGGGKLTGHGSSPELTSPRKKKETDQQSQKKKTKRRRRGVLGDDDEEEDEEEEEGRALESESAEEEEEVLINLPQKKKGGGGGLVGRMLKRSNTAPDALVLSRGGGGGGGTSSSSSTTTATGTGVGVPLGSPARNRVDGSGSGTGAYFALSQSTTISQQIPASPSSAHLRNGNGNGTGNGPPSTPGGSAPPSPAAAAVVARPPLAQKRTYGGGTRSMLATMEEEREVGGGGGERGESYAVLSKRWGIEEEGGESQDTIDLPTITELRARGENQRFLDDLGYIVDGLQGDSVTVKRPSAVDLVRRLLNTEFRRSIKTLDEAENLYKVMREAGAGDGDMVLDAALAIFLAILAKDDRSIQQILRRKGEDCFVVVGKMLRSREDGFSLARSVEGGKIVKGKDRMAVNLMNELVRIHGLSGIGLEGSQISLRAVASSIFASVVTASSSKLDRFAVLEGAGVSKRVAASLEAEIETLPSRIKGHEKGLPLLPQEDPPDFEHVEYCLTVLENLVVRFPEAQEVVESTRPQLPSLLGTLLVACHCLVGDTEDDEESSLALIGMNCLVTALRVLVNVTNSSPFWCEGVLQSPPVITTILRLIHTSNLPTPDSPRLLASLLSSPSRGLPSSSPLPPIPGVSDLSGEVDESAALNAATEALKVDVLCLSLGLLNNLVEGVEAARDRVRRTELSKTCDGSRTCVLHCRCSDRQSGLLLLVDFYTKQVEGTSTEASYLSGYSVLLLSHLLSSSQTNAKIILDALPSPPNSSAELSHRNKLASMASELRDFADVHQRFHQKLTSITREVFEKAEGVEGGGGEEEDEEEGWVGARGVGGGTEVLPAVVPSMEEGVGAVQRMIGVLEGLMKEEKE